MAAFLLVKNSQIGFNILSRNNIIQKVENSSSTSVLASIFQLITEKSISVKCTFRQNCRYGVGNHFSICMQNRYTVQEKKSLNSQINFIFDMHIKNELNLFHKNYGNSTKMNLSWKGNSSLPCLPQKSTLVSQNAASQKNFPLNFLYQRIRNLVINCISIVTEKQ